MILAWLEQDSEQLPEWIGTQSVWTIDLVWVLERQGIDYLFVSETLSVNQHWAELSYYRQSFAKDQVRVQERLEELEFLHWSALERSLSLDQVRDLVRNPSVVALMLVDNTILRHKEEGSYMGHYILVLDVTAEGWVVHNPAEGPTTIVASELLERAWTARGTDRDVVFVSR